jgi:hypothetical protein
MTRALHQRCWNHENRAAVCRCPACGKDFCQECVAEHEGRFLCASCLKTSAQLDPQNPVNRRFTYGWFTYGWFTYGWLTYVTLALAGALLAWSLFFFTGEALMVFLGRLAQIARLEQIEWLNR